MRAQRRGLSAAVGIAISLAVVASSGTASERGSAAAHRAGHRNHVVAPARLDPQLRAHRRAAARRRRALDSPSAKLNRRRSRLAYRRLSGGMALQTARRFFPGLVLAATFVPPRLGVQSRVERYMDDHRAVLRDGAGRHALVVSNQPLRARTANGHLAPVDLTLRQRGRFIAPVSSPVASALPADIRDGAHLTKVGVGIVPVTRYPGGPARVLNGKVFYSNTARDSDELIAPSVRGLEVFTQLRSAASPEQLTYRLSVPRGAAASRRADGTAVEIARGGRVLATVGAPVTRDADGSPVATSWDLVGNDLVVSVSHRRRDYRYPLLVDPSLTESFNFRSSDPALSSATGWSWLAFGHPNVFRYSLSGREGIGLYSYVPQNVTFYGPGYGFAYGDYGAFIWQTPANTNIWKVESTASTLQYFDYLQIGRGIYNPSVDQWAPGSPYTQTFTNNTDYTITQCSSSPPCDPTAGALGNQFWMFFQALKTGADNLHTPYGYLSAANIYITDPFAPSVTSVSASETNGTWRRDNQDSNFTVYASDSGLGLADITVVSADNAVNLRSNAPCNGHRDSRCPLQAPSTSPNWPASLSYNTSKLTEGTTQMTARADDAAGGQSAAYTWSAKIDKTEPTVDTSGELDQADGAPRLTTDAANLTVHASDENDAGTTSSGVQSFKVQLDGSDPTPAHPYTSPGSNVFTQQGPCDSCELTHDFPLNTSSFADGEHTVDLYVTDFAGNQTHEVWSVTIDRTSPKPYCSEPYVDPNGCQPDPPPTTPVACTPLPSLPGPAGGTVFSTAEAVAQTQQTMPDALGVSESVTLESLTVAPALTPDLLAYRAVSTLMPSTVGTGAPTYTVGSGTAGVCLSPSTLSSSSAQPQLVNGTAVEYPNTAPSTDAILRPTPFGVQEIDQIRDSSAPQTQTYQVGLRPGLLLQQLESGSIAVIDPTLPAFSASDPPADQGTSDPPDGTSFSDHTPEAGSDAPIHEYTNEELAGLTPEERDILPTSTRFQYESENQLLRFADQDADGQEVAIITPPTAHDANYADVDTSMAVAGLNTFTITTQHAQGTTAYPVMVSHKTTATTTRRQQKPHYGLSGDSAIQLSANTAKDPMTGETQGTDRLRRKLGIPVRRTASLTNPPTARFVFYLGSCDRWDGANGGTPQDIRTVPEPPGPRGADQTPMHGDWVRCREGAKFIQQAFDENLAPHISVEPKNSALPLSVGVNRYAKSIAALWHYPVYEDVKFWSPVNEPDDGPKLSARKTADVWRRVKTLQGAQCRSCQIVAAELANDIGKNDAYVDAYVDRLRTTKANPHVWALHDYLDVIFEKTDRFYPPPRDKKKPPPSKKYAEAHYFEKRVHDFNKRAHVWLSEQGVLLVGKGKFLADSAKAQREAAGRFRKLAMLARIEMDNYYEFFGCKEHYNCNSNFDSGLVRNPPDPPPNPADGFSPPWTFQGKDRLRAAYCILTRQDVGNCYDKAGR
jgi:hypothetical protein